MPRGDQLARQWKIIETLISCRNGKTAAELSDEIECHYRTVYRDLEALQKAGFPLYTEKIEGKNLWSILDTYKHHIPIPFSLTELMALYFSRDMVKILQNTVFYDSLESLFKKIRTTLPAESTKFLENVQRTFHVSLKQVKEYGKFKGIINSINEAALKRKSVEMVYFTMRSRKEGKRKVDPYNMVFFNGTFYVIGYCHLRKDVRTFALERIRMLRVTDESFMVPDDFILEDYMGSGFGIISGEPQTVKVWFSPEVAGYIKEKTWHEGQEIQQHKDGSIIFEAEVAVTEELISWIMGWGAKAEVLEPKALKDQIYEEVLAMLKFYNSNIDQEKTS